MGKKTKYRVDNRALHTDISQDVSAFNVSGIFKQELSWKNFAEILIDFSKIN